MKTFFICIESAINDHAGEEYDDILEVEDAVTQMTIKFWADRIRQRIRKLWHEDEDEEKGVEIYLDATGAYHTVLMRLVPVMQKEEKIEVYLLYVDELEEEREYDSETEEFLKRRNKL